MKVMFARSVLVVALAATILSACRTAPAQSQLAVNGQPLSLSLYATLVRAEQQKIERVGAHVDWQSADGKHRLMRIESAVIRELVRNAVVDQLAKARGITVTTTDLKQALSAAELAFGGSAAFDQGLQQAGLTTSDFQALLGYRILETKLRQANSAGLTAALDSAIAQAHVVAAIGPCDGSRAYPACLTP